MAIAFIAIILLVLPPLSVRAESSIKLSRGQTAYVPVYSHVYSGNREAPFYLAATLSIRNVDPRHSITLTTVDYYDSDGKLLKRYLEKPLELQPLASMRYVVKESDKEGGSGANFIVTWRAEDKVNPALIESVMIGTKSQQGVSFTSRAQIIADSSD